jgi:transcriptional regulator with XRE-family HTH domain
VKRHKLVKLVRSELSLTGREFGKLMGVKKSQVSKWELNQNLFEDARLCELYFMAQSVITKGTAMLIMDAIYEVKESRR